MAEEKLERNKAIFNDRNNGMKMTAEEAIDYLLDPAGQTIERHAEAVNMAVRALRKQIPLKPRKSLIPRYGMGYAYYDWICPRCGTFLAFEPERTGNHHCRCGQAIDWNLDE